MAGDEYADTSERMLATDEHASAGDYLIYLFHAVAYDLAAERVAGGRVLDFGCGTGYGSHRMSQAAERVVGVDVSTAAVAYARGHYAAPGLEFQVVESAELAPLPFADGAYSAVVSFQVIEHVPDVDAYLAEVARVLEPDGLFLCATPDRSTRLYPGQRPWNRWHLQEWDADGLRRRVARHLDVEEVLGMTAAPEVIGLELARCRRLRRVTLPFTFPGAPERWRIGGLRALAGLSGVVGRVRRLLRRSASAPAAVSAAYPFGPADLVLAAGATPSTNTVLVARKRAGTSYR